MPFNIGDLDFFCDTEFKTELFVVFTETPEQKGGMLARAVWQEIKGEKGEPTEQQYEAASWWLRGSKSLRSEAYDERSGRYLCVDGNGLSMMSSALERPTFERIVVLLALAAAYRVQIERLINELSQCDQDAVALERLARRALTFNARCYFRHPVKMNNIELPLVWDAVVDRYRLQQLDAELTEQAHALYGLVAGIERDREQRRWQWLGLALAFISALQVLTLFSEQTRQGWWEAVTSWLGK
ncbi:hypothetical protein K1I42_04675 [Hydrogenophilus thermoluteolus]|nr:hypothetical protein [Hydrogenophilus thermoluteolus]MBW7656583.1 hypothetical protein [Hydrogenophilus thermoluteolus]